MTLPDPTLRATLYVASLPFLLFGLFACSDPDFKKVTMVSGLSNAVDFEIAKDGRMFILSRYGEVIIYKPDSNSTITAANLSVYYGFEDGLLGLAFAPDFETSHYIYLHYSPPEPAVNRVSRFMMTGDKINMESEGILLEIPVQRQRCCHAGGDLAFDSNGNLYIATGDNTDHINNYAALDENDHFNSAERSSANTMDLRGKILRIKPQPDGSYTIPEDNLFPGGTGGLPEIFVMGARNPYKLTIDTKTDMVFWSDLGPDAAEASQLGPQGKDEINVTKQPGNYGWPHFIGNNQPYHNTYRNYYWDPSSPTNDSRWNTGRRHLPPAQPSWIDVRSEAIMAGPIYHFNEGVNNPQKIPIEFDGHFFFWDFNQSHMWHVAMDKEMHIISTARFAPEVVKGQGFIDVEIGPDHQLYVLEYGTGCCDFCSDRGKLSRIDYISWFSKFFGSGDPGHKKEPPPKGPISQNTSDALSLDQWQTHLIDDELPWRAISVNAADVDNDGKKDIIAGGGWYKNPGKLGTPWNRQPIGNGFHNMMMIHDFDHNGSLDILGTNGDYKGFNLHWARNNGTGVFTIIHDIGKGNTTYKEPFPSGWAAGNLRPGDPYQIVLSWNGGEDGSSGIELLTPPKGDSAVAPWTLEIIHPSSQGEGLGSGDIDGDGDLDIFQGSKWLRNDESTWTQFDAYPVCRMVDRNRLADIDGDGDLDAIVGFLPDKTNLIWLENTGNPTKKWNRHVIAQNIGGGLSIDVADMDKDGDNDVILGEHKGRTRLLIFENTQQGETWTIHVVHPGGNGIDHHQGSRVIDIDDDGDLDIISTGWMNKKVWLFENTSKR